MSALLAPMCATGSTSAEQPGCSSTCKASGTRPSITPHYFVLLLLPLFVHAASANDDPVHQPIVREAENFQRGNARIDERRYGAGIGVVIAGPELPCVVEYDIELAQPGRYELSLRYAAAEPSPVDLSINGRLVKRRLCSEATGSPMPHGQRWAVAGTFALARGTNVLRFTAPWCLPHLDKLKLTPAPDDGNDTLSAESVAADAALRDAASRPRPFNETCFADLRPSGSGEALDHAAAAQWLEPIEGRALQCVDLTGGEAPGVRFSGAARLRAAWDDGVVFRVAFESSEPVQFHFWNGARGVSLYYYPQHHRAWAAYRTTRPPATTLLVGNQPHIVPDPGLALLATDNARCQRLPSATFDMRYHEGNLVLTQGDVVLLSVPLGAAPTDVVLEGTSIALRELTLYRGQPVPREPEPQHSVVLDGARPASLGWRAQCPAGTTLRRLPSGSVRFEAEGNTEQARAVLPLIRPGLYEVRARVDAPEAGTMFYLGDESGAPLAGVELFRDAASGLLWLGPAAGDGAKPPAPPSLEQAPALVSSSPLWLRLVGGPCGLTCWVSPDGTTWSHALVQPGAAVGDYTTIGLALRPGPGSRATTLGRLEVRQLDALAGLAPVALQEQAELIGIGQRSQAVSDLGAWQQLVWELQPQGADARGWRDACAVITLQGGIQAELARKLLDALIDEHVLSQSAMDALRANPQLLPERLRLIDDAMLLYGPLDEAQTRRLRHIYEEIGLAQLRGGQQQALEITRRAMLAGSAWCDAWPADYWPTEVARESLLDLVEKQAWDELHSLVSQLRYFSGGQSGSSGPAGVASLRLLTDWALAQAASGQPQLPEAQPVAVAADWRHPLQVALEKEAFNTLAEVQVALGDRAYDDACQIIGAAAAAHTVGLLPDWKDSRLFGSLQATVAMALEDHPGLQRTMNDRFAPIGALRVRQAMAEGNVEVIEVATLRYYGTSAAAEAERWLGDRLLSGGRFARAIARYRQALPHALASERRQLEARVRLAGAMLGQELGAPTGEPVDFGGQKVAPAQFERLVAEMLSQHRSRHEDGAQPPGAAQQAAFAPARYEPRLWARFDGDMGNQPADMRNFDWAGRQLAAAWGAGLLVVSNRFQVVAYAAESGAIKWTYALGQRHGATHAWPMLPMRPQIAHGSVYARLLTSGGAEITCLDVETGQPRWTATFPGLIVSDPLLLEGELFALVVDPQSGQKTARLLLASFDGQTGALRERMPLVDLRRTWSLHSTCQATVVDDLFVATVAGSVLCCDARGQVRWVRRSTWMPPALHPDWQRQHQQPPLIAEGRVYATQPGVPSIECIDLETGRLHWSASLPGVERMLSLEAGLLVVQTDEGIQGLAADSGRIMWKHEAPDLLEGFLTDPARGLLLVTQREPVGPNRWCPLLVWIDTQTGRETARWPLTALGGPLPMLGPLVAGNGRVWGLAGVVNSSGRPQPQRELVELIAGEPIADMHAPGAAQDSWTSAPPLQTALAAVLPGWSLLAAMQDDQVGLRAAANGQPRLLVTKAAESPTRLARRVAVPAAGRPRLVLQVAGQPQGAAKLEIRIAGQIVRQLEPEPLAGDAATWPSVEIDLTPYAGQTVWLTLVHDHQGQPPSYLHWHRAEVMP